MKIKAEFELCELQKFKLLVKDEAMRLHRMQIEIDASSGTRHILRKESGKYTKLHTLLESIIDEALKNADEDTQDITDIHWHMYASD